MTAMDIEPNPPLGITGRGIDMFRTPALALVEQLSAMGPDVRTIEPSTWVIPKLPLGFTRSAGHEVPTDRDGGPLHFQAILVGPTELLRLSPRLNRVTHRFVYPGAALGMGAVGAMR